MAKRIKVKSQAFKPIAEWEKIHKKRLKESMDGIHVRLVSVSKEKGKNRRPFDEFTPVEKREQWTDRKQINIVADNGILRVGHNDIADLLPYKEGAILSEEMINKIKELLKPNQRKPFQMMIDYFESMPVETKNMYSLAEEFGVEL